MFMTEQPIDSETWENFEYRGRCYLVEIFYTLEGSITAYAQDTTNLTEEDYEDLDGPTGMGSGPDFITAALKAIKDVRMQYC